MPYARSSMLIAASSEFPIDTKRFKSFCRCAAKGKFESKGMWFRGQMIMFVNLSRMMRSTTSLVTICQFGNGRRVGGPRLGDV